MTERPISMADQIFYKFVNLPDGELTIAAYICKTVESGHDVSKAELGIIDREGDDRPIETVIDNLTGMGLILQNPKGRYFMELEVQETIKDGMEKLVASQNPGV